MLNFWIVTLTLEAMIITWAAVKEHRAETRKDSTSEDQMVYGYLLVFLLVASAAFDVVAGVICLGMKLL